MKVGDKIRLNSNYTSCGNECSGSVGTIKAINDTGIRVNFSEGSGHCYECQRHYSNNLCSFYYDQFDIILEHNRNGANS